MLEDRYGNLLSTTSQTARDAYVTGADLFLGANAGSIAAFDRATEADPDFAMAHVLKARAYQMLGDMDRVANANAEAKAAAERRPLTAREESHFAVYQKLLAGKGAEARKMIVAHVRDYPRDAVVAQPATGVFGLIGFSGCDGREAEQLAFVRELAPHYGDDWWFLGQLAFAQSESGAISRAVETIDRSLAGNPRNANAAHIKAHIHYEQGEAEEGLRYLDDWAVGYSADAPLYCHVNWHRAIWVLQQGDADAAWNIVEKCVVPGTETLSPPLNVLTDTASFLFRAELAGAGRRDDLWQLVARYAGQRFPKPGIAFADFHAGLIYAMAGDGDKLAELMSGAVGPAAEIVRHCTTAFDAFSRGDYQTTVRELGPILLRHEKLGGSRAQRDLLEFTYAGALLRMGRVDEAGRTLALRRPNILREMDTPLAGRLKVPTARPAATSQKPAHRAVPDPVPFAYA